MKSIENNNLKLITFGLYKMQENNSKCDDKISELIARVH
jgi:hypothetical protein